MTRLHAIGLLLPCLMLCAGCSTIPEPRTVTVTETRTVTLRPPRVSPCSQTSFVLSDNGSLYSAYQMTRRERDECASRLQTILDWQAAHPEEGLGSQSDSVDFRSVPLEGVGTATR